MDRGKLIVIEGACDGIGKTTQYQLLKEHLQRDGIEVFSHHFPSYNTYQGKPVEMYLQGEYGSPKELSPFFINSLYAMDRAITWETELKREYEVGKVILLDRYTTSSLIYQSSVYNNLEERQLFLDYVEDYEYHKLGIQEPDQVIFLYASFGVAKKFREARRDNEGVQNDIHELNLEYLNHVYENSMIVANYLGWDMINCASGDSFDSKENIHEKVYQKVIKNIK